jgi:hypothetical protein
MKNGKKKLYVSLTMQARMPFPNGCQALGCQRKVVDQIRKWLDRAKHVAYGQYFEFFFDHALWTEFVYLNNVQL